MFNRLKRAKLVIGALLIALMVSVLLSAPARAVPLMPHVFYGNVVARGLPAVDGLTVTAVIPGASFPYVPTAQTIGGRYGDNLLFRVPGDDQETEIKEGGVTGDTIFFYVEGRLAGSYTFQIGGVTQLNLEIMKPPVARFTYAPSRPEENQGVTFDASTSYDPDGVIISYRWNFGDGKTGVGEIVEHYYYKMADYNVTLTVTDNDGVSRETTKTISVSPRVKSLPDPSTLAMVCSGLAAGLSYIGLSRLHRRLGKRS